MADSSQNSAISLSWCAEVGEHRFWRGEQCRGYGRPHARLAHESEARGGSMTMVLVIEEDRTASEWLVRTLETGGHAVEAAGNVETAMDRVRSLLRTDLVVVDLALPRTSGFQFLRELREEHNEVPVIALSAEWREVDRVQAFRLGADQHAVRPIGASELLARVDGLIERARSADLPGDLSFWRRRGERRDARGTALGGAGAVGAAGDGAAAGAHSTRGRSGGAG